MKKWRILIVLFIVGLLFVPAVSAEVIINESVSEISDTSQIVSVTFEDTAVGSYIPNWQNYPVNIIRVKDISTWDSVGYIVLDLPFSDSTYSGDNLPGWWVDSQETIAPGRYDITYIYNGKVKPGVLYMERYTNLLGTPNRARYTIFLNEWDRENLQGSQTITLPFSVTAMPTVPAIRVGAIEPKNIDARDVAFISLQYTFPNNAKKYFQPLGNSPKIYIAKGIEWEQHLTVNKIDDAWYEIMLDRAVNNKLTKSTIQILKDSEAVAVNTASGVSFTGVYQATDIDSIKIISPSNTEHIYNLGTIDPADPGDPDESDITFYIKNSQTGALIANANIAIDALVNGEYYPVVNRTEPSGIFSINLQPTGGGQPNPDGYRLIVTADGYYNPTPVINFTVDAYTKLSTYLYLDPIAGGPVNENKTFIDFFVRDMSSNPISGATVKFGKYTLITNSAGYTVFEVDKNNNYTWTISKSGYGALTGNAVIGDSPRHTINTVLAPIVTPTTTTPIPTSPPIGPTPTMTAPTGEHVSNWLEWFAAHFGMILGGGVEIGKIFMWLCFTVPVGVYVGKEAKAGAAGFMVGAGIVTLFFVLIGWVPIWLVVLMALIIGLLYAKVFNTPDNGGGR